MARACAASRASASKLACASTRSSVTTAPSSRPSATVTGLAGVGAAGEIDAGDAAGWIGVLQTRVHGADLARGAGRRQSPVRPSVHSMAGQHESDPRRSLARHCASNRRIAAPSPCSMPTARVLAAHRRHPATDLPALRRQGAAGPAAGRERRRRQARPRRRGTGHRLRLARRRATCTPRSWPACWTRPASTPARSNAACTGPSTTRPCAAWLQGREPDAPQQQLLGQARRLPLPGLRARRRRPTCATTRAATSRRDHPVMRAVTAGAAGRDRLRPRDTRRAAPTAARSRPTRSRCSTWRTASRASAPASACGPATRARRRACARAVARAPFMVAGTGRFDTRVMERLGERVFCKVGAEGVYCAALPERGLGVAIKIDDGNNARAAEVAMAAVDRGPRRARRRRGRFMRGFSDVTLRNWNGIEVGALRAADALRAALAPSGSVLNAARRGPRLARSTAVRQRAAPRASAACRPRAAACRARMRSMRGKRTAMPLLCRALRLMPSKPSSNTSVGRTLRTGPNFSSVWRRMTRSTSRNSSSVRPE